MDLSNIASVKFKSRIDEYCKYMHPFCGVDYCVIYLIFNNKDMFVLSNIYSHLRDYYEQEYFTHDQSTISQQFTDGYYLCDHHQGITTQYHRLLTEKHQVHRGYYQLFKTDEFKIVLGAASKSELENLPQFYASTHIAYNQFMVGFIESFSNIIKSHNPELRRSRYFNGSSELKALFNKHNQQPLTPREIDCLVLTAQGFISEQIGQMLNISKHTVNQHKKNILFKLNAFNMPNAIYLAMRLGLMKQDEQILDQSQQNITQFRNLSN